MNILEKITNHKRTVIEERKEMLPISSLEQSMYFSREVFSLKKNLQQNNFGIIAEFKKQSPSKGVIHENPDVEEISLEEAMQIWFMLDKW